MTTATFDDFSDFVKEVRSVKRKNIPRSKIVSISKHLDERSKYIKENWQNFSLETKEELRQFVYDILKPKTNFSLIDQIRGQCLLFVLKINGREKELFLFSNALDSFIDNVLDLTEQDQFKNYGILNTLLKESKTSFWSKENAKMDELVRGHNSNNYKILKVERYERSVTTFKKAHYKKNKKGEESFDKEIKDYIENLKLGNFLDADVQSFPSNTAEDGYEFRKKKWTRLPNLNGASRFGRVIFLIYYPKKLIYLLWFYSHEEFTKQPPDKELLDLIKQAKQNTLDQ